MTTHVPGRSEIHTLRSPENNVCFVHAHDHRAFVWLLMQQDDGPLEFFDNWEGQAVVPLHHADQLVKLAKDQGITVIDGPTCKVEV